MSKNLERESKWLSEEEEEEEEQQQQQQQQPSSVQGNSNDMNIWVMALGELAVERPVIEKQVTAGRGGMG